MKYRVLRLAQPLADEVTREVARTDTEYFAEVSIILRRRDTKYRGDVLVYSARQPDVPGHQKGVTCGLVELVETKHATKLTEAEWEQVGGERRDDAYAWIFRHPRRVIEEPVRKELPSFGDAELEEVMCYPRVLQIGEEGWRLIRQRIRLGK